ncbi:uncharacterized protein B0P05DRAFT_562660 [Gilbertella persicaria]|uniref:uncharacterized protein n=1 Tax=Gilbertella persicaria TaxID=101096 RepID=UPI002220E198|nr:uncharacterized protein B0P05DRAFT_562660 [Gilbertella persicaria]KAI8051416.1 hypothetical protein B0P05DRAFT_562660 [Gilbertella persicaria]
MTSQSGTVIHLGPKETYERSYSPLVDENGAPLSPPLSPNQEVWRLSIPMTKKLPEEPIIAYCYQPYLLKALPPVPYPSCTNNCERQTPTPVAQGRHHGRSVSQMIVMPSPSVEGYHNRPQSCSLPSATQEPPTTTSVPRKLPVFGPAPANDEDYLRTSPESKELPPQNKSARQIVVKSIDDEHRVWITVDPKETGKSLAKKIYTLASFRTHKVLGIKTASGRQVMLDKSPLFENWQDMDDFNNGETWSITWGTRKRSLLDRFLSKLLKL